MALDAPRHPFLNRIDQRFTTDDINVPRRRFYFRRIDRRLDVGDIDGTQAGRHGPRWARSVNPLDPIYHLASFIHEPPEPLRFTRNTLDISDIEGTRTTVPIVLRMKTRDHINYDDVQGSVAAHALARWASRPVRPIMKVADINDSGRFRSRRRTDPLSPRYVLNSVSGMSMQAQGEIVIGDIVGSHPKTGPARTIPSFTLTTRDIDGNEPMWRVHRQMKLALRATNVTGDIEGAQADTAGRWRWKRRTNPLAPDYQLLDRGDPPLNPLIAPNIGMDIHELYLDAERQRLRSPSPGEDQTEEETETSIQAGHGSKITSIAWSKPTITARSGRSQASTRSTKKAPSLREIRERQEKAQDQALVMALPAL